MPIRCTSHGQYETDMGYGTNYGITIVSPNSDHLTSGPLGKSGSKLSRYGIAQLVLPKRSLDPPPAFNVSFSTIWPNVGKTSLYVLLDTRQPTTA
ncbi:hypothetical protein M8J76_009332 [Diaphorina citri]|nr:hypothetical protein M8J76_009332 [Diaphorina citri]